MGNVEPTMECANCSHLASAHEDVDTGDNTGACTMANCDCSAMVTGQGSPAGGDDIQEHSVTKIVTLADAASGVSGAPPVSGADVGTLVQNLDGVLDGATAAAAKVDFSTLDPQLQSAVALTNAASASVDMLLIALGVPDSDADDDDMAAAPGSALDPGQDKMSLAEATDAAIVAARDIFDSFSGTIPDGLTDVVSAIHDADGISGDVLAALQAPDPDVEEGTDPNAPVAPDATPSDDDDSEDGMSAHGAEFVDAPVTDDAAAPPPTADDPALAFEMPIMVLEGVDTGDGRYITPEALTWRELPLSVMAMTENSEWGHEGAELVGRIDTVERFDASALTNPKTGEPYGDGVQALKAAGVFASIEAATNVAELVKGGFLRGVSVDVGDVTSELEVLDDNGDAVDVGDDEDAIWDIMYMGGNIRENVTSGRVMGATICPFPAFEGAYIIMNDGTATPHVQASAKPSESHALNVLDEFGARTCKPCEEGMTLAASAGPLTPPKAWFEDPNLSGPTPLTITDDGRVYGHLAAWSTCHTGITGRCTTAPHSKNDYANFHTGALKTLDGDVISVGHITMDTGHADLGLSAGPAASHYDNTGSVVADICAGEDAYGIWVAGATRPDLTDVQLRSLRSNALSGDWRQIGRGLEMVAALAVPVPGFPLPRARVASAATVALTAAGGRKLLNAALGTRNAELEDLRRWQRNVQPVIDRMLNDRTAQARQKMSASRIRAARIRLHA